MLHIGLRNTEPPLLSHASRAASMGETSAPTIDLFPMDESKPITPAILNHRPNAVYHPKVMPQIRLCLPACPELGMPSHRGRSRDHAGTNAVRSRNLLPTLPLSALSRQAFLPYWPSPGRFALQLTILTLSAITTWPPLSSLNWTFLMRKVQTSSQKR